MEKPSIVGYTGGGGNKPQGREGFLSKIPFTNSKFSVSNVNKSNVGVETPTYIKNYDVRIWKKSVNNFSCHPEIAASLVADENEAYKRGCSQSISGSSHRQKCSTICTQKANVGLKAQPAYGYSDEPYRAEHNMDVPQHNPTTCKKKTVASQKVQRLQERT